MKSLVFSSARGLPATLCLFLLLLQANAATRTVVVGDPTVNNGLSFVDAVTQTNSTVINVGDAVHWQWGADPMFHSTTSGTCVGAVCQSTPYWNSREFTTPHAFDRVFNNPGIFPYFCTVHDSNMVGTMRVLPTPATFTLQPTAPLVGAQPLAVAVGDFNGDGKLDVAVANSGDNTVTILLGNGDGTFTPASGSPITGFSGPVSIAVAQFRTVGNRLDLAVANSSNNTVSILLGNGDGTFTVGTPVSVTASPQAVVAADFDADGTQDLAVAVNPSSNPTQNNIALFQGNGDGTFVASPVILSTGGSTPLYLVAFDLYRHSKPDLAVSNAASNTVSVFSNTSTSGTISFGAPTSLATGMSPHGIAAGNFNDSQGNPAPGIGVANQGGGNNSVSVFLENIAGNFVPALGSPFPVGAAPMAVVAGDFNGDGYLDLATVDTGSQSVTTLMNDAAGSFTSVTTISSVSSPRAVAVGAFNTNVDNKPGLAVANFVQARVSILLNGTNFPPATPGPATHFGITVQSVGHPTPEGNPSTIAGGSFQITVTAYDAYQKVASGYTGMVHFTSSDPQPVLPADYTFTGSGVGMDNGVHIFTVTLKTADFQTIEAHDTVDPAINGRSSDILVTPAATAKFVVVAPASIPAGNPFNFTVTARDAFSNQTPNYAGTVQFSSSDVNACVVLPMASTLTAGFGNFSAKLITIGNQTVVATDSVTSSITGMATVNVLAGSQHFAVTPSVTSVIVGTPISITVSARDICEVLVPTYVSQPGHPVHFTSDDTTANVPPDYLYTGADGGTHVFNNGVTFHQTGAYTVTARDTFQQIFGTSPVVNVLGATTVTLAALPRPFLVQQPLTLRATVQILPPATGTPTGTVTFKDGNAVLGTGTLSGNQATFTITSWTYTRHTFTAVYNGDSNFAPSPASPAVVRPPRPH